MKKILCKQGLPSAEDEFPEGEPTSPVTGTVLRQCAKGSLNTVVVFEPVKPEESDFQIIGFEQGGTRFAELKVLVDPGGWATLHGDLQLHEALTMFGGIRR